MIRGFYSASSGLRAQQAAMDVAANNMANVNTVGFKPSKVSFTDLMYQNLNRSTAENLAQTGHGVKVNNTGKVMETGAFSETNYAFDFALKMENGFFAVQTGSGEIQYTRAGNFIMSDDGGGTFYLAASNGDLVLDEDGSEIEITYNDDGEIEFDPSIIGVYRFDNPFGLTQIGSNRFLPSENSGEAEALESPGMLRGYLENSGTEVSGEMVQVIEASKAFSFNSRVVQIADEVEQTVNQLRS